MKRAITAALILLCSTSAFASDGRALTPPDAAGVWTGLTSGAIAGQPYVSITKVAISADGTIAIVQDDGVLGPLTSSCKLTSFSRDGLAQVHCVFTAGAALGAEYDVHWALTDHGQRIRLWVSSGPFSLNSDLNRP